MKLLKTGDSSFQSDFARIRNRAGDTAAEIDSAVRDIISQVRLEGDEALLRLTQKFDGHRDIAVPFDAVRDAAAQVAPDILASLKLARQRIEEFHRRQLQNSWFTTGPDGEILGQIVRPLGRVGLYVPGGKAVYPSSVLMNAIPALVAGVQEIVMVCPAPTGRINPLILAAAQLCGITTIFKIGGAQAVAALAYGTPTVPRVDKIVGPGNIYVATAKKLVYGDVDIDMIAGPSEILIISDGTGDPAWVAADMLSQAEHDELASSLLITTDARFADSVAREVAAQLATLPKKHIAEKSIRDYGAIIIAGNLSEAARLANVLAPEHLELFVADPWLLLPEIKNAGAVFMGRHTPEPVGDYIAGPNHVLPTGGTARFYSPLSVDDFIKKTSLVSFTQATLDRLGPDVVRLAAAEELDAHARSVSIRLK
ncbi:MAG: histidinol dehydrogenase [Proteobacteria bacterium]|nr:histidinol dehydrogenase [Pseudomonadota bacterium]